MFCGFYFPTRRLAQLAIMLAVLASTKYAVFAADQEKASSYVIMKSLEGDAIGGGVEKQWDNPRLVAVFKEDYLIGITIHVQRKEFYIESPTEEYLLAPRVYEHARGISGPSTAEVRVNSNRNRCSQLSGKINMLELEHNGKDVTKLAVDLKQHCDGSSAPLYVWIRYNSTMDIRDTDGDGVLDIMDNCPNKSNRKQRDSNGNGIGDLCDDPNIYTYVKMTTSTRKEDSVRSSNTELVTDVHGGPLRIQGKGGNVQIIAGRDQSFITFFTEKLRFVIGKYPGVQSYEVAQEGEPLPSSLEGSILNAMAINVFPCKDLTGRFNVLEAVYVSGEIARFAADFSLRCKSTDRDVMGEVRYLSKVPPSGTIDFHSSSGGATTAQILALIVLFGVLVSGPIILAVRRFRGKTKSAPVPVEEETVEIIHPLEEDVRFVI